MNAVEANKEALSMVKQRFEEESERSKRDYRRSAILLTRASIDLQNATVRQAAEALSRATRVAIQVDAQVPENLRLTVSARGITLGAVLEAVARQASLKVAPANGGVAITTWPMVDVNGQIQVFKGPWAPWATEWGQLPGNLSTNGWSFPGEPEGAAATDPDAGIGFAPGGVGLPMVGGAPGGYPGLASGQPISLFPRDSAAGQTTPRGRSAATAASLTALGDRQIALAEPGRGPAGQPGVWIAVYRLEGTLLKKIATAFHALKSEPGGIGMPGMGGALGGGGTPPVGSGGPAAGMPASGGNLFGGGGALDRAPSSRPLASGGGKLRSQTAPKAKPTPKK
ncbi:MAG: hypothetical protein ACO1SX_29410 [Actinomycetota bacterium]